MDQQVENCWSFTLTHNLANVLAMHCGPRATPDVHPTLYPTHIPFIMSHSTLLFMKYSYWNIWPWQSKIKVIAQGHIVSITSYRITSLSFHALPFLRYSYFKIWPWKSKVKVIAIGHSVCITYNILSTDIPFFHANWSSPSWYPFLSMPIGSPLHDIQHYQNWTLKIQGQGHSSKFYGRYNILSTHIPFVPCQSALLFLRYSIFKIWPWKTKAKVMGEVKVQSHNVGQTSFRLTSLLFHVNLPSHSWDKFSKFDLANPRSRS